MPNRVDARRARPAVAGILVLALVAGCGLRPPSPREADAAPHPAQRTLNAGKGNFLFAATPGTREQPVRVWYYIPEGAHTDARVVVTMHGSGGTTRPGRSNRDTWSELADRHGFIVVAPEFSWAHYPTASHYHWGNMHTPEGTSREETYWGFTTVSAIFDEVRRRFGITTPHYTLYGHSAGAQFVHRMMIFRPDPRIDAYVAANPGSYTMVSTEWEYPYGMASTDPGLAERAEELITAALQRPLLLLVGTADTATALSANNMRPEAQAQGPNRMKRAQLFFEIAEAEARRRQVPFGWVFRTVPDVAHQNAGMAEGMMRALGW